MGDSTVSCGTKKKVGGKKKVNIHYQCWHRQVRESERMSQQGGKEKGKYMLIGGKRKETLQQFFLGLPEDGETDDLGKRRRPREGNVGGGGKRCSRCARGKGKGDHSGGIHLFRKIRMSWRERIKTRGGEPLRKMSGKVNEK